MPAAHLPHSRHAQRGAALLLAMFIIGLAVTALVVRSYDAAEMKARQEEKTMKALAEAKGALLAWSVAHPQWPGIMPFPDRADDLEGYDGKSDCSSAPIAELSDSLLLGQLPIYGQTAPCVSPRHGVGADLRDGSGNRIWYAVSRNLVRTRIATDSPPIINPGILSAAPYPWLKVVDTNGNPVSDRVAVVLVAPGEPIGDQNRVTKAGASQFLESVIDNNQTFIQKNASINFNDTLVYITIDELISALEKRVVREVKNLNFTPDMVRCTLSGCEKKKLDASLKWNNEGSYVIAGAVDKDYYKKWDVAQVIFDCKPEDQLMTCETVLKDERGNILRVTIPMPLPISEREIMMMGRDAIKLTGQEAIKLFEEDRITKKGTMGPTLDSYFTIYYEPLMKRPLDWPQHLDWYFSNEWYKYIYVVAEEFNSNNAGVCPSSCLVLNRNGQEIKDISQLIFSRGWVNLKELASGEKATNNFNDVNKFDGAVAWRQ